MVCEGLSPRLGYFGEAQAGARASAAAREHAVLASCFSDRLQVGITKKKKKTRVWMVYKRAREGGKRDNCVNV